jgi:predicted short-subunit dehydrogenase-like oxidoreductase (DUF2520 family)
MITSVTLIGTGNVGYNLAHALYQRGIKVTEIYSRTYAHAQQLAHEVSAHPIEQPHALSASTDLVVLAIRDDAHDAFLRHFPSKKNLIVHTSGARNMDAFKNNGFSSYGVFYPLQSFSKHEALDFKQLPLCLESSDKQSMKKLSWLANQLSDRVVKLDSEKRKILHLAAVFANNFSNHLYSIANELLNENEVPFELLYPLIEHTAKRISSAPPKALQTGPAVRGDLETMQRHLEMLDKVEHKKIYEALSNSIVKLEQKKHIKW